MTPAEETEIVRTHAPFVMKRAVREARAGLELDDCVQEGYISLVLACRKWTPEGGANIRTFAANSMAWRSNQRRLTRAHPKRAHAPHASMDAELTVEGDGWTLHDIVGAPATQEETLDVERRAALLQAAIRSLPRRERDVIERRFFEEETLAEIGDSWGLCRERIRQIESAALATLKTKLEGLGVSL